MDKNPQPQYIYIHSIDDIDLKKISLKDLNKRFIDSRGRKYALKFDLSTRKIKIVYLASSLNEAMRIKREIQQNKIQMNYDIHKNEKIDIQMEIQENFKQEFNLQDKQNDFFLTFDFDFDLSDSDSSIKDENSFFLELEKRTKKIIDSINAIEKSFNRVQIFEKLDKTLMDFFDLQKYIEIQCYNFSEECLRLLKELTQFPRNIVNYLPKLPESIRERVEKMEPDFQFSFIKGYLIFKNFKELFNNVLHNTKKLEEFYYKIPPLERSKKPISDLEASFHEIHENTEEMLKKLNMWYSNYQK